MRHAQMALLALFLAGCATAPPLRPLPVVPASLETPPVGVRGDAADDPAIWAAPDPAQSRIIGTQKQGGLFVYDLNGALVQEIAYGRPNNVDLRDRFPWPDGAAPLIAASDRADNSVTLWRLDPATGRLEDAPRARIMTGFAEVYGVCLGRSGDDFIAVATSKIGEVKSWRVDAAEASAPGILLGGFALGSIAEGCAVDDATGAAYVGQELEGLWRFDVSDPDGADRRLVDRVGAGRLVADVEGVAIWRPNGASRGFIVVSSQGDSSFVVYDAGEGNAPLGAVRIGASADGRADAVSGTDGVDVTAVSLGPNFPRGLLVVQDDENTAPTATQNFKYVSWDAVEAALNLPRD